MSDHGPEDVHDGYSDVPRVPESPKGEPRDLDLDALTGVASEIRHDSTQEFGPDYTSMQDWAKRMDCCIDSLRSRLRTQRERLEKVRDEMREDLRVMKASAPDLESMPEPYYKALGIIDLLESRSWLAALDTILKEEGL